MSWMGAYQNGSLWPETEGPLSEKLYERMDPEIALRRAVGH